MRSFVTCMHRQKIKIALRRSNGTSVPTSFSFRPNRCLPTNLRTSTMMLAPRVVSQSRASVMRTVWRSRGTQRGSVATAAACQAFTQDGSREGAASCCLRGITAAAAMAATGLVLFYSSNSNESLLTQCEATTATMTTDAATTAYTPAPNPVWPAGIRESDIDLLVQDCLNDPTINIPTIPDYLERQIYRSTIKLTLNAMYQTLGSAHGMEMLGHELRVERLHDKEAGVHEKQREFRLEQMRGSVADDVLDRVVDGLLENKAVNQPLIPDVVERQLYKNCLVIMFRVLDMMAATFSITCCGHDLRFTLEPSQNAVFTDAAVQQATKIDPEIMLSYARRMGVQPEKEVNESRSWWDRFFRPTQEEVLAQLHATLYSLVLGILDDVLAHTNIRLLSDSLQFDLVPIPLEVQQARRTATVVPTRYDDEDEDDDLPSHGEPSAALAFATFTAGLGVGITLMSFVGKR